MPPWWVVRRAETALVRPAWLPPASSTASVVLQPGPSATRGALRAIHWALLACYQTSHTHRQSGAKAPTPPRPTLRDSPTEAAALRDPSCATVQR